MPTIKNKIVKAKDNLVRKAKKVAVIGAIGIGGLALTGSLTSCEKEDKDCIEIIHQINLSYEIKDGDDAEYIFDKIFMADFHKINQDYFNMTAGNKNYVLVNIKINSSVNNIDFTSWWYLRHFAALTMGGDLEGSNWANVQGLSVKIDWGKLRNITVYENDVKEWYETIYKKDWNTPSSIEGHPTAHESYLKDVEQIKRSGFNVKIEMRPSGKAMAAGPVKGLTFDATPFFVNSR